MLEIKHNKEVSDSLKAGVDKLANAVKVTLGPKGRNVLIHTPGLDPKVTKDGVTVAKSVTLKNPLENAAAILVKRVAEKSNDNAGDGTTTATVLAQELFNEGSKMIEKGTDPVQMKIGMDFAKDAVIKELDMMTTKVSSDSKLIESIATISANNDSEIGSIVAKAFKSVGSNGAVNVIESNSYDTEVNVIDGFQFDRGLLSPNFSTSKETVSCEMENPLIFLVEGKLTSVDHVINLLKIASNSNRQLLIIADDVTGDALSTLVMNRLKAGIQVSAVKSPGFGKEWKYELLDDMATMIGAYVLEPKNISDVKENDENGFDRLQMAAGSATSVKMGSVSTVIMDGKGIKSEIAERVTYIEDSMIADGLMKDKIERLKLRKAKLTGGVAVISVGGASEVEMKEKKDRIDDAKEAVQSALDEGVVIGGGVTLLNCKETLNGIKYYNDSQLNGIKVVAHALEAPLRTICFNAGVSGDQVISDIASRPSGTGFNAKTGQYVNMLDEGILDPKKVTRTALEGAVSIIGTLLTTSCSITPEQN